MASPSASGFDVWEVVNGLRDAFTPRPSGRMGRGDIRTAILAALMQEPMHGYQIIQAIEARTAGAWKPSPGSIYPTLQLLADEGLISGEQVGERKVYSLTDSGRAVAEESADGPLPGEPRHGMDPARMALPKAGAKLAQAAGQVMHNGTPEQAERAVAILDDARRKLYALLAED
jgi:DNA-binding PadR family transcriptional regulator